MNKVNECFSNAKNDEEKGKKHKGLLFVGKDDNKAKEYIKKAKENLELCELLKEKRFDYKIPEEWFYTLYYCAMAILTKFGVESRSQRCTALFLRYIKNKGLIEYDDDFIDRITVYSEKEEKSDVDEREKARYSPSIQMKDVELHFDKMMHICKDAISQCEEIVYSDETPELPKELF